MGLSGAVWDQACEVGLCFLIREMGITTVPHSGLVCRRMLERLGWHAAPHTFSILSFTYKMPTIVAPTSLEDEMNL